MLLWWLLRLMLLRSRHIGEMIERSGDNGADAHGSLRHHAAAAWVEAVPAGEAFHAGLTPGDELGDGALGILLVQRAEAWVVLPVVHLDDIAEYDHEGEEVLEEAGARDGDGRAEGSGREVVDVVEIFPYVLG